MRALLVSLWLVMFLNAMSQPMSGNYNIGTSQFPSFNAAVESLINNGVSGPVTFTVSPGVYNESITIPEIAGASETNTITFKPKELDSTLVTLTSNATQTVLLNGAGYIRFLYIGIKTNSHHCISLQSEAHHNLVSNCIVEGGETFSESISKALIYSGSGNDINNVFVNNHIIGGSYGFYYKGENGEYEAGTTIKNNIFDERGENAVYTENQKALEIIDNIVNLVNGYYSIWVENCFSQFKIIGNKLNDGGIVARYCTSNATSPSLIANNFVFTLFGSGVINHYSDYIYNLYNTVILEDGPGYTGALYCGIDNNHIYAYNNILINTCDVGGTSILLRSELISDYNVLYSTSYCVTDNMNNSPVHYSFDDWVATGNDNNSKNILPEFISATDLHSYDEELDASGTYTNLITYDIDGDPRNSITPDIGADEFTITNVNDLIGKGLSVSIFPNPAHENIRIKFDEKISSSDKLYLSSVNGQIINISLNQSLNDFELVINRKDYNIASGVYTLVYKRKGAKTSRKILILDN